MDKENGLFKLQPSINTKSVIVANKRKLTISTSEEEEEDVEEESESEPEVDCDKWDDDCKIVKTEPKHSVQGCE